MSKRNLTALFLLPFLILAVLLAIDHTPRFYFGDSSVYLRTGVEGHYPTERSWVYGIAARAVMTWSASLDSIVFLQTWIRAAAIGLMAILVAKSTRSTAAAVLMVVFLAIDPLALYCDRAILTDSAATSLFMILLCLVALSYSTDHIAGRSAALLAIPVLASFILLLRVAYLPVLAALIALFVLSSVAAKLGYAWAPRNARCLGFIAAALGLGLFAPLVVNKQLTSMGYAYNSHSTRMLVAVFSPAMKEKYLQKVGLAYGGDFKSFGTDKYERRNYQLWAKEGLIKTLYTANKALGEQEIERRVKRLWHIIVTRNPRGVAKVVLFNFLEAVDPRSYSPSNATYAAEIRPNKGFPRKFLRRYVTPFVTEQVADDLPKKKTPSDTYLQHGGHVIWLAFLISLASPLAVRHVMPSARAFYCLVSAASLVYALSTSAFSVFLVPRYMSPLIPSATLLVTILIASLAERRGYVASRLAPHYMRSVLRPSEAVAVALSSRNRKRSAA